jgi:hypothetical protein
VCGGASATSPLYPTSRGWDVTQDETNHVLGVGLKYDFGFAQFDVDYTVSLGTTKISYDYNGAALGLSAAVQDAAGNGFEDLKFNQHSLNANLLVPVTRHTAVRVLYRLEYAQISDWHYEGVAANPVPTTGNTASQVYLDAGPQDYTTQFVGVLLSVKF